MVNFKYSCLDLGLNVLGLSFLLLDIVLDIWAVVSFYQDRAYVSLAILVLLLVGSSVLTQAFSWSWYSEEDFAVFRVDPVVRSLSLSPGKVKLLHVLQCGIYIRWCKPSSVPSVACVSSFTTCLWHLLVLVVIFTYVL